MGMDISIVVEHRKDSRRPWTRIAWSDEHDRSYALFTALAGITETPGVRVIARPRGLPDDASSETRKHFGGELWVALSYLNLAELEAYDWASSKAGETSFWNGVVPALRDMAKLGGGPLNTRIVFGFTS